MYSQLSMIAMGSGACKNKISDEALTRSESMELIFLWKVCHINIFQRFDISSHFL